MNCPLQARRDPEEGEKRLWNKMSGLLGTVLENRLLSILDHFGVGTVFYKTDMQALAEEQSVGLANVYDNFGKLSLSGELCLVWSPGGG
jgi:hypothetical protein